MPLPRIHSNGTPRQRLIDLRTDAAHALREARERLAAAAPHLRDYPNCYADYNGELDKHHERLRALDLLIAELMAEAEALDAEEPWGASDPHRARQSAPR